ncbi:MAG TPA: hypothetical protein VJM57_02545 [Thermodesulfobacteriota bacterium]|nr:hypothetical protein [Thermodesulfobacteriota bacterium]
MIWLRLFISLALPSAGGYLFISWALDGKDRPGPVERVILGFGAGAGLLALEIFIIGLIGLPFSFSLAAAVFILLALPFLFLRRMHPGAGQNPGHTAGANNRQGAFMVALAAALFLWIGLKTGFVLYEGFNRPIVSLDAWWNWSSGAKFFYYSRGLVLDPSNEHFFGSTYRPFLGYPILNSLLQVWVSLALGTFHEAMAKAWAPIYFIGVVWLVFFAIRREAGFLPALLTAFFLSTAPLLTYHAVDAYSDLPLSFYVLAGSIFLWRHMEGGGAREAAISGLFFSVGAFTKNEGLVYLAAAWLALLGHSVFEGRSLRPVAYFTASALLYLSPWLLFKASYGLGYGHGYGLGTQADIAGGVKWVSSAHLEVIGVFFKELFLTANHSFVFHFLALSTVLAFGSIVRSKIKYLYFIVIFMVVVFLLNYTLTEDYRYVLDRSAVNRNALTFLPLAFFIAGLLSSRALKGPGAHEK